MEWGYLSDFMGRLPLPSSTTTQPLAPSTPSLTLTVANLTRKKVFDRWLKPGSASPGESSEGANSGQNSPIHRVEIGVDVTFPTSGSEFYGNCQILQAVADGFTGGAVCFTSGWS